MAWSDLCLTVGKPDTYSQTVQDLGLEHAYCTDLAGLIKINVINNIFKIFHFSQHFGLIVIQRQDKLSGPFDSNID